ncbi:hypothetical protein RRF57_006836 [Xylaria bambusicola]|uniref:Uncharacterized protein n=1 Tax=Xylaria bambusicola TaxID=326684 RepID=A0AAN7USS7_9PEZI
MKRGRTGDPLKEGSEVPLVQGQVIATSGIAAYSREKTTPPVYTASKAALVQLAQQVATNSAPYQI